MTALEASNSSTRRNNNRPARSEDADPAFAVTVIEGDYARFETHVGFDELVPPLAGKGQLQQIGEKFACGLYFVCLFKLVDFDEESQANRFLVLNILKARFRKF